ncbi:MAG: hypothetical protein ABEJ24_00115 [Candidatus Magasanikbacteria bacterium]
MKKKFGKICFAIFFLFLLITPFSAAYGVQDTGLQASASAAGLSKHGGVQKLAGQVIGYALSMVGVLFFILVVYGGVLWMTARGDEDQVKRGRNTIIAAAVGMIIVLASYALTNFVLGALSNNQQNPQNPQNNTTAGAECNLAAGRCIPNNKTCTKRFTSKSDCPPDTYCCAPNEIGEN